MAKGGKKEEVTKSKTGIQSPLPPHPQKGRGEGMRRTEHPKRTQEEGRPSLRREEEEEEEEEEEDEDKEEEGEDEDEEGVKDVHVDE